MSEHPIQSHDGREGWGWTRALWDKVGHPWRVKGLCTGTLIPEERLPWAGMFWLRSLIRAEWSPKPPPALYETHHPAFTPLGGLGELTWPLPGQSSDGVGLQTVVNPSWQEKRPWPGRGGGRLLKGVWESLGYNK